MKALGWLTLDAVRRLLREPQVVRSVSWPIALVPLTLMLTILAYAGWGGTHPVAITARTPFAVVEQLHAEGFPTVEVSDPRSEVQRGRFRYGVDTGDRLYVASGWGRALQVERAVRIALGAPWRAAPDPPPTIDRRRGAGLMVVLGMIFVLFGVVFGAGMVARDRDEGTLEVLLAAAVPRWVHGASRWLAGTVVLTAAYTVGLLVIHAIIGVEPMGAVLRHGGAACAAGVALGVAAAGWKRTMGFGSALARGIGGATGMAALGAAAPALAAHLPVASLVAGGDGWTPVGSAALLGAGAVAVFTARLER